MKRQLQKHGGIKKYKVVATDIDELTNKKSYTINGKTGTAYESLFGSNLESEAAKNDFKRRVFDCKQVHYNKYGRVDTLNFEERKINYTEGF